MAPTTCNSCLSDDAIIGLAEEEGLPLLVIDCNVVRQQYAALKAALPGVTLHYAIKVLPHPSVLGALAREGASFDVASSGEIELLRAQGIPATSTIHTHPVKSELEIQRALAYGCEVFVVDNAVELRKMAPFRDRVKLLLRLSFRNPAAVTDLSKKFGCAPDDAMGLLQLATSLGLHVIGLSFHAGSQCVSPRSHAIAIEACRGVINLAAESRVADLRVLDIGGGFPIAYSDPPIDIREYCAPIRRALRSLPREVQVLAEPGRFIAALAAHGVSRVIGKALRGKVLWYYLDDGVYGSYSGQVFDQVQYPISVIAAADKPARLSCLAGPTCDSVDVMAERIWLPELELGDLVVGHLMGAYTSVTACEFNSLPKARQVVLNGTSGPTAKGSTTHTRLVAVRRAVCE